MQVANTEMVPVEEYRKLAQDAARWRWLRDQCGDFGDGSAVDVELSPDDATRTWFIRVDRHTTIEGSTLEELIDAEIQKESPGR